MKLLKKYFDAVFAAPNGIQKLREVILTLAMQGELTQQESSDISVSELLKTVYAKKHKLIKEKKIKKSKKLPEIQPEDIPGELPPSWEWVRFFTVNTVQSELVSAIEYPSEQQIAPDSIEKGSGRLLSHRTVEESGATGPNNRFYKGQILYSKIRPSLSKAVIAPYDGLCSADMYPILTHVNPEFMLKVILSETFLEQVRKAENRVKMPKLNLTTLGQIVIPLPPLSEQRRIVAKIDQLMARCDELEKLRAERDRLQIAVHKAACDRLLTAPDTDTFKSSWQFITKHFSELYSVKENVAELRTVILQLAVMGKLVSQDGKEPSANELIEEIRAEKQKLITEKQIKKPKPLPRIESKDMPYKLPEEWCWCYVWDIAQLITSGSRGWAKYYSDDGATFVTMGNLSRGGYNLRMDNVKYVSPPMNGEGSRTRLEEHDLLISITGDVGNLGLIPKDFGEAYINQHTCLLRLMPSCRNRYFAEVMRTPLAKSQFNAPQRGIKNSFRLGDVGEMIIPLPPLPEQHRIVAKVNQLMTLCDTLEQQIDATTQTQTALLNATLANI